MVEMKYPPARKYGERISGHIDACSCSMFCRKWHENESVCHAPTAGVALAGAVNEAQEARTTWWRTQFRTTAAPSQVSRRAAAAGRRQPQDAVL